MKRRVYTLTTKRQKIVNEAMNALRDARAEIPSELIDNVREAIAAALERKHNSAAPTTGRKMHAEHVSIDKKKNLHIVMKFLELQPDNKALHREIHNYLSR